VIKDVTPVGAIEWDAPGKRLYHVPFTLDATWGRVRLPLCIIHSGKPGKTVVAIGGTHGNEYEGPVGIKKLIHELDPDALVAGRLIAIPTLNVPAFRAGTRDSPLDGANMNRAFPGEAHGTITSRIGRFVTDEIFPRADIIADIHAAGESYEIARCASFHLVDDRTQFEAMRDTALLFGAPWVWIYARGMGTGLLCEYAEALGKIMIGSEFGYGDSTDLEGVRYTTGGLKNVMRANGVLRGRVESLLPSTYDRQRFVSSADLDTWMIAPVSGISEPLVPVGTFVRKGTPVAAIHDFERFDEPPFIVEANLDGYVMVRRFRAPIQQGDVMMVMAQEIA
jgi:predicted deacylase